MNKAWTFFALAAALWTIPWKGMALWRAAKRENRVWFIVLLLINTLGILEIIYLILSREKNIETSETAERPLSKKIV